MATAGGAWVNPCGGAKWRELPDGRIEVRGRGIQSYGPSAPQFKWLAQTWNNFGGLFNQAGKRYGIPPRWILAIASIESGFVSSSPTQQASIVSTDGFASVGIMQPLTMVATKYGYSAQDRYDPAKNVDMGAHELLDALSSAAGQAGLPAAAAIYNAGHACPTASNLSAGNYDPYLNLPGFKGLYPSMAIRFNNLAVELKLGAAGLGTIGAAALGVGLVMIGALAWNRLK